MYSNLPAFVLGFHGCERAIGENLVANPESFMKPSSNSYDWLGHGCYFWENSDLRAIHWSEEMAAHGKIKEPFVIGAIIDLGQCLNLVDPQHADILKGCYDLLVEVVKKTGEIMPYNKNGSNSLDCAVINLIDQVTDFKQQPRYDTVRAPFLEGEHLYPGACFRDDTHMQICVRNNNCIKGLFHVRKMI